MKITILGPAHPYRGGIAAFAERLAREFQAEGHEVSLVTFTLQYPSFLFPGKTQYSSENAPEGLPVRRMLNSVNPISWIRTGLALRHEAPDVLAVSFWMPFMAPCLGMVSRIVRRNGKTRSVALLHNLVPHEARPGDRPLVRYFCASVDRFVAMSKSVLADIDLFDVRKPRVFVPHPLYDTFGTPVPREEACRNLGLDPSDKILLFFGLIRDYKGLDILLQAYAGLSGKATLVVAGEFYGGSEKYHALARSLGIDDKVAWRSEFVPDSEVRQYFCAADLVVQPYRTATQSGVTQIAYHFGRPMLVTNVGGLSETVPDGKVGYVVEPDAESVAAAIDAFLRESPDFSTGIADEKKKYSWSRMAEAVLA